MLENVFYEDDSSLPGRREHCTKITVRSHASHANVEPENRQFTQNYRFFFVSYCELLNRSRTYAGKVEESKKTR